MPGEEVGGWFRDAPRPADRGAGRRRPEGPGPLVRPGHGPGVVRHGAAHGDLGARPGRGRRAGRGPRADRAAAARRRDRRTGAAVELRGARAPGPGRRPYGSNSLCQMARRGPPGRRRPPTSYAAPRWTSAWSSRSDGIRRTSAWRCRARSRENGSASPRPSRARPASDAGPVSSADASGEGRRTVLWAEPALGVRDGGSRGARLRRRRHGRSATAHEVVVAARTGRVTATVAGHDHPLRRFGGRSRGIGSCPVPRRALADRPRHERLGVPLPGDRAGGRGGLLHAAVTAAAGTRADRHPRALPVDARRRHGRRHPHLGDREGADGPHPAVGRHRRSSRCSTRCSAAAGSSSSR